MLGCNLRLDRDGVYDGGLEHGPAPRLTPCSVNWKCASCTSAP